MIDVKDELYEFFPVPFVNRVLRAHVEGTLIICKVHFIDAIVSEYNFAMIDFQGEEKVIFAEVVESY